MDYFNNDTEQLTLTGPGQHVLEIENGPDKISLFGSFCISRDRQGLAALEKLQQQLSEIHAALSAVENLPDEILSEAENQAEQVANPFLS